MRPVLVHARVFLIALSGPMFEVGLTRISSATLWYHFAFLAISVALFGWGLGGLVVQRFKARRPLSLDSAALLSLAYAAAIPLCLGVIVRFPFRQELLPLYFAASLVPFLLGGMVLATVFDLLREKAPRLYFADLVGASLGALSVTLLRSWLGGGTAVLAVALLPALAAACFSPRRRAPAAALFAAVALAAGFGSGFASMKPRTSSASRARPPKAWTSTWPRPRAPG